MRLTLALLALLAFPAAAAADTIIVPPGQSITAAYQAAQFGDVIELGCGNHGQWDSPSGGTKAVTIRAQTRNCAKFTRLHAKSSNITFDGIDVDAGGGKPMCGGSDCAAYETWGGQTNIVFRNGRIGNVGGQKGAFLHGVSSTASQGVVIENTLIHDVRITAPGQHLECVMSHSPGVTFRGNVFRNCGVFDISLGLGDWWGQPQYGNVTIENNVFGHTVDGGAGDGWHYIGLAWWLSTLDGARVVNNTFESEVGMDRATRGTGAVWANNIGGGWTCGLAGVTYSGNVGRKCSATDKAVTPQWSRNPSNRAPMGWLDPAADDFHLTVGSPAVDAGDPVYAPTFDREGKARVGAPDAGAYEFGTPPEPTPTPTPEPTPTPTPEPTPTPTPTPEPYSPECAPDCDELIAHLRADAEAHEATIADLTAERDELAERVEALEAENAALSDTLDRIREILGE